MKKCGRCQQSLPLSSFRIKNKIRGTYQSYCIECNKQQNREHYLKNKDAYREKARLYEMSRGGRQAMRHGLDGEVIISMYAKFDGKCWCCRVNPAAVVDHDHNCCPGGDKSCGKCVRGLLCKKCNMGIGMLGDSVEGLEQAVQYLKGPLV